MGCLCSFFSRPNHSLLHSFIPVTEKTTNFPGISFPGERWQKPILKDTGHANPDSAVLAGGDIDASLDGTADRGKGNYRIDPRVMTVEHHDGDNQDEKVSDVLRVADDIEPAPHPPVPQAMRADADVSNPLEQAATMADVYFLRKMHADCCPVLL